MLSISKIEAGFLQFNKEEFEILGGVNEVHSKLGQGSTFTIIMPIHTPVMVVQKKQL